MLELRFDELMSWEINVFLDVFWYPNHALMVTLVGEINVC